MWVNSLRLILEALSIVVPSVLTMLCVCVFRLSSTTHTHKRTQSHAHTHRLAQFVRRVNHVSLWDHGTTTLHLELEIGNRNRNSKLGYVFRRSIPN